MATKKSNPFDKFKGNPTKKAKIKALDGAEIEYRDLTMEESDSLQGMFITGLDDKGQPEVDVKKYTEIKYHKLALAVVDPKMSAEEYKALSKQANEAIVEILGLLGEDKEEGNES